MSSKERPHDDYPWKKLRAAHRRAYPFCVRCGARGEAVDHIVPVRQAPERRLDPTNVRTLCTSCHSKITAWHDTPGKYRRERGATADGMPLASDHPWFDGTQVTPADRGRCRK